MQISLDGGSATSHDQVRGAGTFDQALDTVAELCAARLRHPDHLHGQPGQSRRLPEPARHRRRARRVAGEVPRVLGHRLRPRRGRVGHQPRGVDRRSTSGSNAVGPEPPDPDLVPAHLRPPRPHRRLRAPTATGAASAGPWTGSRSSRTGAPTCARFLFDTDLHFANMVDGQVVLNKGANEFDLFTRVLRQPPAAAARSQRLHGRLPGRGTGHGPGLVRRRAGHRAGVPPVEGRRPHRPRRADPTDDRPPRMSKRHTASTDRR